MAETKAEELARLRREKAELEAQIKSMATEQRATTTVVPGRREGTVTLQGDFAPICHKPATWRRIFESQSAVEEYFKTHGI